MPLLAVPVIDIAPFLSSGAAAKRTVAAAVNQACEDIGFWVMTGHGVDSHLCNEVFDIGKTFFDLPVDEKVKLLKKEVFSKEETPVAARRGYIPVAAEAFSYSLLIQTPGDLRESFSMGRSISGTKNTTAPPPRSIIFLKTCGPRIQSA